jgi:hypothetical protein
MRHPVAVHAYSVAYLATLLLGYGCLGWLLAAFQVPWPIWLGSLGVTIHLIYSGSAAIALSSSWVVGIMFLAAAKKSWPEVWDSRVPHIAAQLWAERLLLIWLVATGLIVLLAFAGAALYRLGVQGRFRFYGFVSLVWAAMGSGWFYYQLYSSE